MKLLKSNCTNCPGWQHKYVNLEISFRTIYCPTNYYWQIDDIILFFFKTDN